MSADVALISILGSSRVNSHVLLNGRLCLEGFRANLTDFRFGRYVRVLQMMLEASFINEKFTTALDLAFERWCNFLEDMNAQQVISDEKFFGECLWAVVTFLEEIYYLLKNLFRKFS
jgi:hypothetical protein